MRAILMAAGVGSRISNRINGPKCTLEIDTPEGKKPLIRYTVERMLVRGYDVCIVVGYMHDVIEGLLEGLDIRIVKNPFYRVTNSIASLWFARDLLTNDQDTILMNADLYWSDEIMDLLESSQDRITMLSDVSRRENGDYFFGLENGHIVRYGKQLTLEERDTEYVGLALLKSDFMDTFRERLNRMIDDGKYDLWWENVLYEYCDKDLVMARDVNGSFWAEIDYFEDYMRILEYTKTFRS